MISEMRKLSKLKTKLILIVIKILIKIKLIN